MREERRALELRIDAADQQVSAAKGGKLPVIAVTGGYDYARPNPRIFPRADRWDDSWDAGVAATWSLWDGGRTRAETIQASSVADAARQRLAEFDSIVALEVRQRILEIDSGRAAVTAADDAVRAAAEARRVITERTALALSRRPRSSTSTSPFFKGARSNPRDCRRSVSEARLARALGR
jgi:outer membrane protein TolC